MSTLGDLIVDTANDQLILNATFHKNATENYETYKWGTSSNFITVTLDWDNTGMVATHQLNVFK